MSPENDVYMRVWVNGMKDPSTYVLAAEAYMQFEAEYDRWRRGAKSGRQWVTVIGEDGTEAIIRFSDIVVRQMTTRGVYEAHPDGAFQTLEELTEDYLRTMQRKRE